jgi:hypothetical protein
VTRYRIGVLHGDGIGPEVVPVAVVAAEAAARAAGLRVDWVELPVGLAAYREVGSTLPLQTLQALEACHGWVLGPVEHHRYEVRRPEMPNPSAVLRKRFDLYANVRPARTFPGVPTRYEHVDLVVVRENTEGFYPDRNVLEGDAELRVTQDVVVSLRRGHPAGVSAHRGIRLPACPPRARPSAAPRAGSPPCTRPTSCAAGMACSWRAAARWPRSSPTSPSTTSTWTPPATSSCATPPGSTSWSPPTCSGTSSATWPRGWWAVWGWPPP